MNFFDEASPCKTDPGFLIYLDLVSSVLGIFPLEIRKGTGAVDPQVLQYRCLGTDGKTERTVEADRDHVNGQLPAVHFPGNTHLEHLQPLGVKIIIAIQGKIPLGGKVKTPAEIHIGSEIFFKTTQVALQPVAKR